MKKFFSALPDRTFGALLRRLSPRRFESLLRWLVCWYLNRRQWVVDSRTPPESLRIILAFDALLLRGVSPKMVVGAMDAPLDLASFLANVLHPEDRVMVLNTGHERLDHALFERICPNVQHVDENSASELPPSNFDVIVLSDGGENASRVMARLQQLGERFGPRTFLLRSPRYDHEQDRVLLLDLDALIAEAAKAGLQIDSQVFTWDAMWTALVPASIMESTTEAE